MVAVEPLVKEFVQGSIATVTIFAPSSIGNIMAFRF